MSKKTTTKSKGKAAAKAKVKAKPAAKKAIKKAAPAAKKKTVKSAPKAKSKAPVKKEKAKAPAKKVAAKVKPAVKKAEAKKITPPVKKSGTKTVEKPLQKTVAKAPAAETPQVQKPSVSPPKPVVRQMPINRRPEPVIRPREDENPGKTRYSDAELEEFRAIINKKLDEARKELALLQAQMTAANEHGTDDTASTFKILEDGSDSLAKEEAGQLAARQKKFIEQLENAMIRIENKTYGICRVTGKLIPKERLRAVPHTTQSIEAKLNQYRD